MHTQINSPRYSNGNKRLDKVKRIDTKELASSHVLTGISNRSEFL